MATPTTDSMGALEAALTQALARPDTPVAAAVEALCADASRVGATDVHLAPDAQAYSIRYRLDGVLVTFARLERETAARVIARLKVLAGLPGYVTDLPQEGRIGADRACGGEWRLATFPTVQGERAVLRAFSVLRAARSLAELSLPPQVESALAGFVAYPRGALLLTGPAGSGKTTTIYAALADIQARGRHVHTLEDPVEHALPGASQTQVAPAQGLTFARALRSLLRQDPEVLMVGEVRDRETADIAMEAALTGHAVLTTVHGETATGALARLRDLGIEPTTLTSAVAGVVSQRLLRRRCGECVATGCDACRGTGYQGRVPCAEWVALTPGVRAALLAGADEPALAAAARADGHGALVDDAARLLAELVTTTEEVERVLGPRVVR